MVDTDDTRRTSDDGRRTTDAGRRTTPWVWHKLPTGELKKVPGKLNNQMFTAKAVRGKLNTVGILQI